MILHRRNLIFTLLIVTFFTHLTACGQVEFASITDSSDDVTPDVSTGLSADESQIFLFASDYASSGQLYVASYADGQAELDNSGVSLLGTEAVVRYEDDLLYVLHAGAGFNSVSTDNLQIIDPFDASHPFKTIAQYSTGNGTNPMDVVVDSGRAFITLYNPEAVASNVDVNGDPADLIVLSTSSGSIIKRISFRDYLNDDGDKQTNAYRMVLHDDVLYVLLQDLQSTSYSATSPGLIALVNVNTLSVMGVIELQTLNPGSIAVDTDNNKLIVSAVADYSYSGSEGGVEIIDIVSRASETVIPDSELGGYVEKLAVAEDGFFAVVARYDAQSFVFESRLVYFADGSTQASEGDEWIEFGDDIRDVFVQGDFLWISYRVISTSTGDSAPNIKIYDLNSSDQLGSTLYPDVPGISITGER